MLVKLANQQMLPPLLNNKKEASVQNAPSLPLLFRDIIFPGMLISLPAAIPFCWIQMLRAVRQCLHDPLAALI